MADSSTTSTAGIGALLTDVHSAGRLCLGNCCCYVDNDICFIHIRKLTIGLTLFFHRSLLVERYEW